MLQVSTGGLRQVSTGGLRQDSTGGTVTGFNWEIAT